MARSRRWRRTRRPGTHCRALDDLPRHGERTSTDMLHTAFAGLPPLQAGPSSSSRGFASFLVFGFPRRRSISIEFCPAGLEHCLLRTITGHWQPEERAHRPIVGFVSPLSVRCDFLSLVGTRLVLCLPRQCSGLLGVGQNHFVPRAEVLSDICLRRTPGGRRSVVRGRILPKRTFRFASAACELRLTRSPATLRKYCIARWA